MQVENKKRKKWYNGFFEFLFVFFQALLLAVVIRSFFFQPFSIPSGSMRPTLLKGDYLFVSKWSYGYSRYSFPFSLNLFSGRIGSSIPERGDVAVFRFPHNPSIDFIKRVIGLPGDRIQMKNSQIFINGVAVKREKIGQVNDRDVTEVDYPVDLYRETLPNGLEYDTLDIYPDSIADNTVEFQVPVGHYFMIGDNRDNSSDSRLGLGFVPAENLIGRAEILFFSISGNASPLQLWRWPEEVRLSRITKKIN